MLEFELIDRKSLNLKSLDAQEYLHRKTGVKHYHFACEDSENAFLIGFRTHPMNNTGVAHVLEHLVLSGSKKYPCRSAFFHMDGRTMNTYMNALTSADITAYAFATRYQSELRGLQNFFIDLTLNPILDKLDFLQEGIRLEHSDAFDSSTPLVYRGVVYNEMSGEMTNIKSMLWYTLCSHLFRKTTYAYCSGGIPSAIEALTYENVVKFHADHYIPTNAAFISFGSASAENVQSGMKSMLEGDISEGMEKSGENGREPRFSRPVRVESHYTLFGTDTAPPHYLTVGWLLGESDNMLERLTAKLVESLLLESSTCPLRKTLKNVSQGILPSPLNGLQCGYREMVFVCGAICTEEAELGSVNQAILEEINLVASHGFHIQQVESALDRLEIQEREVGGDRSPRGIGVLLRSVQAFAHDANPIDSIEVGPWLAVLRDRVRNQMYLKDYVFRRLVENPHQVTLYLHPDTDFKDQRNPRNHKACVAPGRGDRSTSCLRMNLVAQSRALANRQRQSDDLNTLPTIDLDEVVQDCHVTSKRPEHENVIISAPSGTSYLLAEYDQPTNGIAHREILLDIPQLEKSQRDVLRLYSQLVSTTGSVRHSARETIMAHLRLGGRFGAAILSRSIVGKQGSFGVCLALHATCLSHRISDMCKLMEDAALATRYDEIDVMSQTLGEIKSSFARRMKIDGHAFAMSAAARHINEVSEFAYVNSGIGCFQRIPSNAHDREDYAATLAPILSSIQSELTSATLHLLHVGNTQQLDLMREATSLIAYKGHTDRQISTESRISEWQSSGTQLNVKRREIWIVDDTINHCARVWEAPPYEHIDGAALSVVPSTLVVGSFMDPFAKRAVRMDAVRYMIQIHARFACFHTETPEF